MFLQGLSKLFQMPLGCSSDSGIHQSPVFVRVGTRIVLCILDYDHGEWVDMVTCVSSRHFCPKSANYNHFYIGDKLLKNVFNDFMLRYNSANQSDKE